MDGTLAICRLDNERSGTRARVTRVVPGKLVYVAEKVRGEPASGSNDLAITLDHVFIRQSKRVRPYSGEELEKIGLKRGRIVELSRNHDEICVNVGYTGFVLRLIVLTMGGVAAGWAAFWKFPAITTLVERVIHSLGNAF
jgi:hypothetical protein